MAAVLVHPSFDNDNLHYSHDMAPVWNNPWGAAATTSPTAQLFANTAGHALPNDYDNLSRHSSISYGQDYHPAHPSAAPQSSYAPLNNISHFAHQYATLPSSYDNELARRQSYSMRMNPPRNSFSEASVHLPQHDMSSARSIYGGTSTHASSRHNSLDYTNYPQPQHHHQSHHSSFSSASGYPHYFADQGASYPASVEGSSATDYSSQDESAQRPLPAPGALFPPERSAMMTQFSSKVAPPTDKKHKCPQCSKRFTRPSSLQTHIFSHTGEKRESS